MFDAPEITEEARARAGFPLKILLIAIAIVLPLLVLLRLMRQPAVLPPPALPAPPAPVPPEPEHQPPLPAPTPVLTAREATAAAQLSFAFPNVIPATSGLYRALRLILAAVVVLMPLLMLFGLLHFSVPDTTLDDYVPYWSDDVYYWRQAASFGTVGFDTGYFTYAEQPAQVGRFYAWGMFAPVFLGTFGRLFGIVPASIPLLGAVLLSLALAVFVWATRLNIERLLWLLLALAAFIPLWIFHISSYLEESEYALTVLIAASFFLLIKARRPTLWQAAFALVAVLVAALLRPSMALFFVLLFILLQRRNSVVTLGLALAVSAALAFVVWSAVSATAAPYTFNAMNGILATARTNLDQAGQLVLENATANLQHFTEGEAPQLFERAQMVVAAVALVVTIVLGFWRLGRRFNLGIPASEALLYLYSLAPIMILYILLYDIRDWRDFRGMAPHLLFVVLLLVAMRRRFWLAAFVVSGLLFLPQANATYTNWAQAYVVPGQHAALDDLRGKLAAVLPYLPDAPSPWCNTVLHTVDFFSHQATLIALPPQMAVSFSLGIPDLLNPPRSRYFLVDPVNYASYADRLARLQPLLDVPGGTLYFNPDSACHAPVPQPP